MPSNLEQVYVVGRSGGLVNVVPGDGLSSEDGSSMAHTVFEELFDNAPCGYLIIDEEGRIVLVNATFLRMGGWQRHAVEGSRFSDLLDAGSRIFYETKQLPVLQLRGEAQELALALTRADGHVLPVVANASVTGTQIRFTLFDSTVRGEYEQELVVAKRSAETSEARLRALQDAATTFGSSTVEESLTQSLVNTVKSAMSAMFAAVMLVDGQGPLSLGAGANPLFEDFPEDAPRPSTVAFETARPVVIFSTADARKRFPAVADGMVARGVGSLIVTPLLAEESAIGVVACFFDHERQFDQAAIDLQLALARQAAQAIARIRLQRLLEAQALHDPLTGLGNRAQLHDQASRAIAASAREGAPLAVMFLDLDGFKSVNDILGHSAGDALLSEVATRLRSAVRHSDAVGRYGGDEFVAICEHTDHTAAEEIADRIREAIRAPFDGVTDEHPITASVGVALWTPGTSMPTPEALLDVADAAMYRAKEKGRDLVEMDVVDIP